MNLLIGQWIFINDFFANRLIHLKYFFWQSLIRSFLVRLILLCLNELVDDVILFAQSDHADLLALDFLVGQYRIWSVDRKNFSWVELPQILFGCCQVESSESLYLVEWLWRLTLGGSSLELIDLSNVDVKLLRPKLASSVFELVPIVGGPGFAVGFELFVTHWGAFTSIRAFCSAIMSDFRLSVHLAIGVFSLIDIQLTCLVVFEPINSMFLSTKLVIYHPFVIPCAFRLLEGLVLL